MTPSAATLIAVEIAARLGLPAEAEVPFVIDNSDPKDVAVRLPAPGASGLDCLESTKTRDITGRGATLVEALENAYSAYHMTAATEVSAPRVRGSSGRLLIN